MLPPGGHHISINQQIVKDIDKKLDQINSGLVEPQHYFTTMKNTAYFNYIKYRNQQLNVVYILGILPGIGVPKKGRISFNIMCG